MTKTVILSDPPRETKSRRRRSKLGWVAQFHCLTFLTDYGLEDAFVAVCHAVASQVAPGVQITDITHLIPLGDIRRGAMVLAQAVPYFPPAVHVAEHLSIADARDLLDWLQGQGIQPHEVTLESDGKMTIRWPV